jgi:hypothetical protein
VEEADGMDDFLDRMAVRASVSIDGSTDETGDAGHGFEAFEVVVDGEVDEVPEDGSGIDADSGLVDVDLVVHELQDDAAKAFVGDDEVAAGADDHGLEAA